MEKKIHVMQDYGKISFHIGKRMDEKNINRNRLAKMIGVRFEVADRFYKGNIERLDMDILARICFALECRVEDLMCYVLMKTGEQCSPAFIKISCNGQLNTKHPRILP